MKTEMVMKKFSVIRSTRFSYFKISCIDFCYKEGKSNFAVSNLAHNTFIK